MNIERDVYIIHHTDADGFCSGAIVKEQYPKAYLIPCYYDTSYHKLNKIPSGSLVWIVDASYPNHVMRKLADNNEVIWIDHHETAITESLLDPVISGLRGKREVGKAACELTWEFMHPDKPMPYAVHLIGRYDIHDLAYFPEAKIFNLYLYGNDYKLNDTCMCKWIYLFSLDDEEKAVTVYDDTQLTVQSMVESYRLVYEYQIKSNKISAKAISYEAYMDGLLCIVANRSQIGSDYFDSVVTPEHMLMVSWHITKFGYVKYTVFSNSEFVNVGELMKKFETKLHRGGGNPGVGGIRYNKILTPGTEFTEL